MLKPLLAVDLLERGFSKACRWVLDGNALQLSSEVDDRPGVYAFCMDGVAQYVGLASKSLRRRIKLYANPGRTQTTNIRLNQLLSEMLDGGTSIDILVASPPDSEWNGWSISGAEGLEAALIRDFDLPWNVRGSVSPLPALEEKPSFPAATFVPAAVNTRYAGKYGPLRTFLEDSGKDRVTMTFRQIEGLVGKLPKSASLYLAWWGNHQGNTQAQAWLGASYQVEANPVGRSVIFRKFRH